MSDARAIAPMDPAKRNSRIVKHAELHATIVMNAAQRVCFWNDQEFPEGSEVSTNGNAYECSFGCWVKQ